MTPDSRTESSGHAKCDMDFACSGDVTDDVHAARDDNGDLIDICDGCLDEGYRMHVEVLD
jgi:hypothetical protein